MEKITYSRYGKSFRFTPASVGSFSKNPDVIAEMIKRNVRICGLTRGDFSLIDLIHSILQRVGKSNVIIVTWSAGIKDAHQVRWLIDTELINEFYIVTDRSYKTRQKKYAIAVEDLVGVENIRTSDIHAKFTLIWNRGYFITIRHSMNLNANRTCESFEIDENKHIFEFYKDFVDNLFEDMPKGFTESRKIVDKPLNKYFGNLEEDKSKSFFDDFGGWE